jgi:hypothetical protein
MPAPQFGITPGLKILPSHNSLHSQNNMLIGRKRKRSRHLGVSKKSGTGRRRRHSFKRRRRRRKRKHQIPVHPALFTWLLVILLQIWVFPNLIFILWFLTFLLLNLSIFLLYYIFLWKNQKRFSKTFLGHHESDIYIYEFNHCLYWFEKPWFRFVLKWQITYFQ